MSRASHLGSIEYRQLRSKVEFVNHSRIIGIYIKTDQNINVLFIFSFKTYDYKRSNPFF